MWCVGERVREKNRVGKMKEYVREESRRMKKRTRMRRVIEEGE